MLKKAIDCLEDIASKLEERGLSDQALQLDAVVNTLENSLQQPLMQRRDYGAAIDPVVGWLKKYAPGELKALSMHAKMADNQSMQEYLRAKKNFLGLLGELKAFYSDETNWLPQNMESPHNPGRDLSHTIDPLHPEGTQKARQDAVRDLSWVIQHITSGYEPADPSDTSKNALHEKVIEKLDNYIRNDHSNLLISEAKGVSQNSLMEAWQKFNKAYVLNFVDLGSLGLGGLQVL